jgi:hypothetical protein
MLELGQGHSHIPPGKFYSYWKELLPFTQRAWELCVGWFGPPSDPDWPAEIICSNSSRGSACNRIRLLRRYYLFVHANFETETIHYECANLAHEMYHRVTYTRPFLRSNIWIDEAMAYLTAQKILKTTGYQSYAKTLSEYYREERTPIDLADLRSVRPIRHWNPSKRYPPRFHVAAFRLGEALQVLVPWDDLCTLVKSPTLEAWMQNLFPESHFCVEQLLHPKQEDLVSAIYALKGIEERDRPDTFIRMGFAFFTLGHMSQAETLYREAVRLRPGDSQTYKYLGYLFTTEERYEEAVDIHFKVIEQGASDADSFYKLGYSLEQLGRIAEARIAWKQALDRDEGEIGQMAKQALEENPL